MTNSLVKKILMQYKIKNFISFKKVEKGVTSNNYIVKTKSKKFFLKQHRVNILQKIGDIEHAEQFFVSKGFPVVSPIQAKEGFLHYARDGVCYVLYPFVRGESFPMDKTPKKIFIEMGKKLAQAHLLSRNDKGIQSYNESTYFKIPNKKQTLLKMNQLLKKITVKNTFDSFVVESLTVKKKMLQDLKPNMHSYIPTDRHMCFGDYYQDNIFFNQKGQISYIFDLDMAGRAPRLYELVRSCMLSCFWYSINDRDIKNAGVFITAYYKIYPFSKKEFKKALELYYIKSLFSVWMESDHYEKNDTRTDVIYKTSIDRIKYLSKNRSKLAAILCSNIG